MPTRNMKARKRIALVAHDNKKPELIAWVNRNIDILTQHTLFATGTTGGLLEETLNVSITKYLSGPLGGDQQIGAAISEGEIDILFFFWDPMAAQPHDPDVKAVLRLAAVWNIPIACDSSSADFLISSPLMNQEYEIVIPDYSTYLKRTF